MNRCDAIFSIQGEIDTYFQSVLEFLERHKWIYDVQLTQYCVEQVWSCIPPEWKDAFENFSLDEIHAIPDGFMQDAWPQSLKTFIAQAQELSLLQQQPPGDNAPIIINKQLRNGMCPKKIHEVTNMAVAVADLHGGNHSRSLVVDVGSGLGYLGQVLSSHYGLKTFGLEGNDAHAHGAVTRAKLREVSGPAFESVAFQLFDNEKCFSDFQHLLKSYILDIQGQTVSEQASCDQYQLDCDKLTVTPKNQAQNESSVTAKSDATTSSVSLQRTIHYNDSPVRTSLVGLHCCGDLTPTMLHLFACTTNLHNLVCVSCCYHRMSQADGKFNHFPLSNTLKDVHADFSSNHHGWRLNTFALRLASQETRARWKTQTDEDHNFHTNNVAYRGILEAFFAENGKSVQKKKRKMASRKAYNNFESYIDTVVERISLEGEKTEEARARLRQLYQNYEPYFTYIEPFTCLQVVMQPVLESLILIDRVAYLREKGLNATLTAIMCDHISPRNMAIIVRK